MKKNQWTETKMEIEFELSKQDITIRIDSTNTQVQSVFQIFISQPSSILRFIIKTQRKRNVHNYKHFLKNV